jgi:hypothetical protein
LVPSALGADPVPVKRLTLQPAAAPSPALKYHLLPDLLEQTPGNAALDYYRAYSPEWLTHRRPEVYQKIDQWLELPPGRLPRKDLDWILTYKPLHVIDEGARREYVDWDMTRRLRQEGFSLLIPEMQGFRDFAKLLKLRAELAMLAGDYDKAVHSLQTGFALSRHLDEGPTLIVGLVGAAIANMMADEVEALIQSPNAPNLYWALTDLPHPLLNLRRPYQGESLSVAKYLPSREELEARPLSVPEAQKLSDRLLQTLQDAGAPDSSKVTLALLVAKSYTPAKQFLIKSGLNPALVEAMPAPQVVLLYSRMQFDRFHDDLFKWLNLPFWEAQRGIAQAERELVTAKRRMEEGLPFASLFLPAAGKVLVASARLERRLAVLRVIEAIRLYGAAHEGQLPAALRDITAVPIPIDPVTGKEFDYRVDGDKASLSAPPPPGYANIPQYGLHYEIMLKR